MTDDARRIALQSTVERSEGCSAAWADSVAVVETFNGETVWDGSVEVFDLAGHPVASRCYAWAYEDDDGKTRHMVVLHQPPVDSPERAVQAAIAAQVRRARSEGL